MSPSDGFDRAIDKVAMNQSPRTEMLNLDPDEEAMVRFAQRLAGTRAARPSEQFSDQLRDKLRPRPARVTRRAAFLSGFGALAAGIAAGIGIERETHTTSPPGFRRPIVGANGKWVPVAQIADVPHGAIHSFSAGAIQGFLLNHRGQFRAVSRICTHMGCRLNFERGDNAFICPCHGAEFELSGQMRLGPGGYDSTRLLPALPQLRVRVNGPAVEVWTV